MSNARAMLRARLRGERWVAWAMIAPATLVILAITILPLLRAMWMSLFHIVLIRPGVEPYVGLGNYIAELTSPVFWGAMVRTVILTVSSAGASLALGLGLGVLMNQPLRGRWFLRSVIILPWALPGVVNAFMWQWIDHAQYGALNALLTQVHLLGTYQNWLGDPSTALWMIVTADVWKNTPLVALLVLASLQTVPRELNEAAEVDGANVLQVFRRVTLPLIMPMLLVALVLRTIDSIKLFNTIYVMTGGGPANATQTISLYAYKVAFQVFDFGKGATLGWLITFVTLGFVVVYLRLIRGSARASRP